MIPFTNHRTISLLLSACVLVALPACQKKELQKKSQEQKLEITRLEEEIKVITEQISSFPADRTAELEEIKIKTEQQAQDLLRLEEEFAQLDEEHKSIEANFQQYKKTYAHSQ